MALTQLCRANRVLGDVDSHRHRLRAVQWCLRNHRRRRFLSVRQLVDDTRGHLPDLAAYQASPSPRQLLRPWNSHPLGDKSGRMTNQPPDEPAAL
jgi:hypothetical protein